jgi:PAS domain S-box-containing protein
MAPASPEPARPAVDFRALLTHDPVGGKIHLGRERMLLVSVEALGTLRQELREALGPALAATVLFRFGRSCGREEAERILRDLAPGSREETLRLGPLLHAFEGVAGVRTDRLDHDPVAGTFAMEGAWLGSYEAEQHLRLFPPAAEPVCRTLAGYATGFATAALGRELLCTEVACRGSGDAECRWSIAPAPPPVPEPIPAELRTAFRELETRLAGQEALARSLGEVTEALGQITYTVDERGLITSWTHAAARAFRLEAGQVLGHHERILFPGDRVAAREPERLQEECRTARVAEAIRRRRRGDGTEFQVLGGRSPIRDGEGRTVGATVVLRPVDPVEGVEGGSRRTLQALLESVPAGIALADAGQRIVECNRGFREMLGLPEEGILGLPCHELLAGIVEPCTECPGEGVFARGSPGRCQPSFTRRDGSRVYFDLRSFPLRDAEGRVTHEIKYVRDVTREVERDRELDGKRRLAALGEMAARVAHEVKNPLAGMRGALQVLASRKPEGDAEREILGEVVAHIDRLDGTVRDLLVFSRPSDLRREATRPDDVVGATLALLREAPEMRGIGIAFAPSGLPEIALDRQQVIQVLTNLLQNAAQAIRPGDPREIDLAAAPGPDGTSVEFSVRDRGPGIPPALWHRIASPFFTTKVRGTGLGLAISRRIVEAHGGTLEFDAAPGGGTVFRARIPGRERLREV